MNTILQKLKATDKYLLFIYMYIFLMPWNFEKSQMGILTAILLIWWIIKFKTNILIQIKSIVEFKPLLLLIVFIAYTYLSVLWSDSFKDGFEHVNQFHKYYWFIIPILFTSLNKEEALIAFKVLIVSFGVYAVFSILIYLGFISIDATNSDSDNPKGIMAYAIMSTYMAIGSICAFFIGFYAINKKEKILFLIIAFLCLFTLFINNSRTAQLSLILTILTVVVMYARYFLFKLKYILSFLFLIIISCVLLYHSGKFDRYKAAIDNINQIVEKGKYEGSLGVRLYFYKFGLEIIKDNFLFGMGSEDNIKELEKTQKNDSTLISKKIYSSFHSQHLDTLTRYGFVGYFLLIFSTVYLLFKLREYREIYFIALSFFLITFYTSLSNVMLIKKPFNYIYIAVFVLFSIVAYSIKKKKELTND